MLVLFASHDEMGLFFQRTFSSQKRYILQYRFVCCLHYCIYSFRTCLPGPAGATSVRIKMAFNFTTLSLNIHCTILNYYRVSSLIRRSVFRFGAQRTTNERREDAAAAPPSPAPHPPRHPRAPGGGRRAPRGRRVPQRHRRHRDVAGFRQRHRRDQHPAPARRRAPLRQ